MNASYFDKFFLTLRALLESIGRRADEDEADGSPSDLCDDVEVDAFIDW